MRLLINPLPTPNAAAALLTLRDCATCTKAVSMSVEIGRCWRSEEIIVSNLKTIRSHYNSYQNRGQSIF
jgi:hypothetical protein